MAGAECMHWEARRRQHWVYDARAFHTLHQRKFDGTTGGAGLNDFRPLTGPGGFGPDTQAVDQIRRMGSPPPDLGAFSNGAEPPERPHIETLYYTSKVPNRYNSSSYQEQW